MPGRHRADRNRRQCRAGLYQSGASGRRRAEARRGQGARGHRGAGRREARHEHRGGGIRGASDCRLEHDPRTEGGVERARPRPAGICAGRVRRQRADFAAGMAEAMGMPLVLIPPSAGVFSSFGLLYADVEYHFARTRKLLLRDAAPEELQAIVDALEAEARAQLTADGFAPERIEIRRGASLHYQGQSFELRTPLASGRLDRAALAARRSVRGRARTHLRPSRRGGGTGRTGQYRGRRPGPSGNAARRRSRRLRPRSDIAIAEPRRSAYFGPTSGWLDAELLNRSDLRTPRPGPCIVEEYDFDLPDPAGLDRPPRRYGNIAITRSEELTVAARLEMPFSASDAQRPGASGTGHPSGC